MSIKEKQRAEELSQKMPSNKALQRRPCSAALTLRFIAVHGPAERERWAASLQIRKGYVMNYAKRGLLVLLVINIGTSILHYVDNILFFYTYPEPHWINPQIIDAFWFVMTPFAALGYILYNKGLRRHSYLCFYLYALMSLLVLGHYRYGSMWEMSMKMNLLIMIEAIAAVGLIAYTIWLQLRAEETYEA